ncbi:MAG: hypothetical protein IJL63_00555 [Clostridia bacterium]|nr:hypothetical protein [Clostridia bacterium]
MTKEKKDNVISFNKGKKNMMIIYIVIAFVFIAFFLYQIFKINYSPVKTQAALEKTVSASTLTEAFVVRDEYPITANITGTLVPLVDDGKRVASGDNVAVVFTSDEAAKNYNEIKALEKDVEYYSSLQNKVGVQTSDIEPLDERVYSACEDYIIAINSGNADTFGRYQETLREYINSRQLSTGSVIDPSVKLEELNTQLEQLKRQNIGYNTITAPHPGYYISIADGYEDAVDYQSIEKLTTEQAINLFNSELTKADVSNYMGKLVDGFNWYLICVIDYEDAIRLKRGSAVDIEFTMTSAAPLKATVASICNTVDNKTAVVFRSNLMNTSYAGLRNEQIRVTFDKHTGLQISNKAIREVDGEKGVYVLSGNIVEFKKINIEYSDSDFSYCTNPDSKRGFLELYDEVITEGTDLYDGKIIN